MPRKPWLKQTIPSFSFQLVVLALVLLTVPAVLYWQFDRYEQRQQQVLHNAVSHMGEMIAAVLKPHLEHFDSESSGELRKALDAAAIDGTNIKLLLRLQGRGSQDFFYVAAAPEVSADYLKRERSELIASGIFNHFAPACDRPEDLQVRFTNPAGQPEVLTSLTPVHVGAECWIVLTSENAASLAAEGPGHPVWSAPALRIAAILYVLSAVLILWLLFHLRRNVTRFRQTARRIRLRGPGPASFREINTVPELAGVAEDFDAIVSALTQSQAFIRQTAEENTHALKTPLATIAQSLEPLRRAIATDDAPAQRSLELIERSVARLDTLVSDARDLEEAVAEVLYPEARPLDLSDFVANLAQSYAEALALQKKRLTLSITPGIIAYGNEDLLEPVLENLLENAASYTREGGAIELSLSRASGFAKLSVADRGPGADPQHLPHLFDRRASFRTAANPSMHHQGLGLWIVKRNIEGLGGTVTVNNREGGGFEAVVRLKLKA